jgi:hypothetical protein
MALTSLESIAEKLKEKKQLELEKILKISGSAAITKNEYNITVVNESNAASSLLFKPLTKTKLNRDEIVKAIDIEVKELKPDIPIANRSLVPKPLYDAEVSSSTDLRKQVADLTTKVSTLSSEISTLKEQVTTEINNRLAIEQSNDVLVNQLDAINNTLNTFSNQIATSLQKSVEESILRASLQSQNTGFKAQIESLIKQIDSLNSIIEGLQSQLGAVQQQQAIQQGTQAQAMAAGADVVNKDVIVKIAAKTDQTKTPIWGKINADGGNKWVNGATIDFTNNGTQDAEISLTTVATQNINFFSPTEPIFSLAAGQQKSVKLVINESAAGGRGGIDSNKNFFGWSKSADYKGGSLKVSVKKADGSVESKTYEAGFTKSHPKSY